MSVWRKHCITLDMLEYFRGRKAIEIRFDICKDMLDTWQRSSVHHVVPICLKWHGKIDSLWATQSAMNCVDDNSHSTVSSQHSCRCFTWNIDICWLIIGCNTDRANQGLAPLILALRNEVIHIFMSQKSYPQQSCLPSGNVVSAISCGFVARWN